VSIRAPGKADPAAERRKVKLNGRDSLATVARRVFKDERVTPLLADMNPKVPRLGAIAAGAVVVLPSREEAQKFAARMGFQLGFDPAKGGSTKARRDWKKLQHGAKKGDGPADPAQLARTLAGQGHAPAECARRLVGLVPDGAARDFATARHDDADVRAVAAQVELALLRREVRSALVALVDVLDGTTRARGRRRLIEAAAADAARADEVLGVFLVAPALRDDLVARASAVAPDFATADELAKLDEHQADVVLSDLGLREARVRALVEAARHELPLVDSERLALLGLEPQLAALDKHCRQLLTLLRKLVDTVERAPRELLHAVLAGEAGAQLPKPWPVVVSFHARVGGDLARVHAGRRAEGLGALIAHAPGESAPAPSPEVPRPSEVTGPIMSAAELAAAAAANAKHADEHDDVPERLSPVVIALFDPLRPSPPDSGPEAQVKQRRKARFERAVLGPKDAAGQPDVIVSLVEELLELGADVDDDTLRRRFRRLKTPQRSGALALARLATEPIPALLRGATDVARALIVVSLALDPELGPTLARAEGREAALALLRRHATRTITLAAQAYANGR
jgi:hypothetical protein